MLEPKTIQTLRATNTPISIIICAHYDKAAEQLANHKKHDTPNQDALIHWRAIRYKMSQISGEILGLPLDTIEKKDYNVTERK